MSEETETLKSRPTNPWVIVWQSERTSISPPLSELEPQPRRSLEPVLRHEIARWRGGQMEDWELPVLLEKLSVCRRLENLTVVDEILKVPDLDPQTVTMAEFAKAHIIAVFVPRVAAADLLWALRFGKQSSKERQMALIELIQRPGADAWGPVAKSEDLGAIARWSAAPSGVRAEALAELVARGHPDVPRVVAASLGDAEPGSEWGHALLHAAERVDFHDDEQRRRVLGGLTRHAEALRDATEQGDQLALWAALRRYSSMAPVGDVGWFSLFLSSRQLATRQCTLQAIANAFSREPPPDLPPVAELRGHVRQAMEDALALPRNPEQIALVVAAFVAAAALAHGDLPDLARLVHGMKSSFARRRALRDLGDMQQAWGEASGPAAARLREAMEILGTEP